MWATETDLFHKPLQSLNFSRLTALSMAKKKRMKEAIKVHSLICWRIRRSGSCVLIGYPSWLVLACHSRFEGSEESMTFTSLRSACWSRTSKNILFQAHSFEGRGNMNRCRRNILLETCFVEILVVSGFNYFRRRSFNAIWGEQDFSGFSASCQGG